MSPTQIVVLLVLLVAVYLCWNLLQGRTGGVPLYVIVLLVPVALLGAVLASAGGVPSAVETLNVVALSLSLAALPAAPSLWEREIGSALSRTRLYQATRPSDLLSWRAWLKLVDRLGARRATVLYLLVYVLIIGLAVGMAGLHASTEDRTFGALSLMPPALFAFFSALWIYQGTRRLVPGS
jgi:hypothetical protein